MRAGRSGKNGAHSAVDTDARINGRARSSRSSARACCTIDSRARRSRRQTFDRLRHDLGHHARALAAAEHQQIEFCRRRRARKAIAAAAITCGRTGLPVKAILACQRGVQILERVETGGDSCDARREQPVGAAHDAVLLVQHGRHAAHSSPPAAAAPSDSRRSRPPRAA